MRPTIAATLDRIGSAGAGQRIVHSAGPLVVVGLAYFVAARVGAELASVSGVSAVWPGAGVALAGLLIFGPRVWPAVAVSGFFETLSHGFSVPVALVVSLGQTLVALGGVGMLRAVGFDRAMSRLVDLLALTFLGAFASSLIGAAVGPTAFWLGGYFSGGDEWPFAWFVWWVGDAIGVLIVTPLVLLVSSRQTAVPFERGLETLCTLAATALAGAWLFGSELPNVFLIFPFPLWAALRLGLVGTAATNMVVVAVSVWTTVNGHGPFADLPSQSRLVSLQSFNASMLLTSLLLAAVMNERRRALDDVRDSRARIVETADVERRRLERDLHDGAQQRLVSLSYTLGLALARLGSQHPELSKAVGEALDEAKAAQAELRSLAQGIHPAVLTQEGLSAALASLSDHCPVPVEVRAPATRYPAVVEATAYFVAAEGLANVAKHARATTARIVVEERDGRLVIEVTDNGAGGADPTRGSGLVGLADRAAALGGQVTVKSPPGGGTVLRTELPCGSS